MEDLERLGLLIMRASIHRVGASERVPYCSAHRSLHYFPAARLDSQMYSSSSPDRQSLTSK